MNALAPIPITVLTGFLGSGKTTVLNALLRQPEAAHSAVIVNEFGEIGIDHDLVQSSADDLVLLNAGCLCCTVRGDLVTTLSDLAARRDAGTLPPFARVLVETTGLADPAPIIHTLMAEGMIDGRFRLARVVTLVDAVAGDATLDAHEEAMKQAAVADLLLLTKTDLAADCGKALRMRLAAINPGAAILVCENGAVDAKAVLGGGFYDLAAKGGKVAAWLQAEAYGEPSPHAHPHEHAHDHGHDHGHRHAHDVNRHDDRIRAFAITLDRPVKGETIDLWLGLLTALKGPDLLRVKGILNIEGAPGPYVIHGVQHVFHPALALERWPSNDRRSRIVFITRDIERSAIEATLNAFVAAEEAPALPRSA
jgi:G3E family GTPase